jgi:HD-GYP domain-containing protein (c-di-GMP phosphodiesterase class II)
MELSTREYIWLDMDYKSLMYLLPDIVKFDSVELELDDITSLTRIFANIIDFRNPFTFNHSAGVAVTASALAGFAGFSEAECKMMLVAGYLHDLGKLAVSNNILNKPGFLNEDEMNVIRSHTFFTFRLLQAIRGFETINKWASFHHERMDGNGYPFHLEASNLPLGSRIMAVADIFTAITEDRPYRAGMDQESTIRVLQNMAEDEAICPYVLSILLNNLETVNALREKAQKNSKQAYNYIMSAT